MHLRKEASSASFETEAQHVAGSFPHGSMFLVISKDKLRVAAARTLPMNFQIDHGEG